MEKILSVVAALGQDQLTELPEWYTLYPDGVIEVEDFGQIVIDEESWQLLSKYLERRKLDVVFDYEHQTLKDVQAPASGWVKGWRYEPGVGIQARIVWTEKASQYLLAKEYRYFSPVSHVRKSDRRLYAIHSAALTNTPRTNHLQPLLAKLGAAQTEEDNDMLKMILAALGLAETATEDEVKTAIAKLQEKKEVVVIDAKIPQALGIEAGSDVSVVVASINALKQEKQAMVSREEFNALQAKLTEREVEEVVAKAMAAGKIAPDQKEWATDYAKGDLKGFETFVAKAPVVVPLKELGKKSKTDDATFDESTLSVAAKMGVSKEDLEKYGK